VKPHVNLTTRSA